MRRMKISERGKFCSRVAGMVGLWISRYLGRYPSPSWSRRYPRPSWSRMCKYPCTQFVSHSCVSRFLNSTLEALILIMGNLKETLALEMRINIKPHFGRRDGDEDPGDMGQTKKQNHQDGKGPRRRKLIILPFQPRCIRRRMPGVLDNLEDLAILRSPDVSTLDGNVLLAVSDRRESLEDG